MIAGAIFSPLASNHDKILVVDGQKAVTGGRNVAIDYFADPRTGRAPGATWTSSSRAAPPRGG
jgi:phosphatidylserine/phosphatidylglycerophosphate/cardiolipin synthase-like enzyme